jgi:signal transduction histidine kinase/CheY-like chemotaxis protein
MGVSRDVTERKRAEEALQLGQERMQVLVEHLPEGIVLLDSGNRIVLTNPAANEFLLILDIEKSDDRLVQLGGISIDDLLATDPADMPHELVVVEPHHRIFELAVKPIWTGPDAGGWILVMRDVTEERETQEHVQQQERLAAVGQLAAGVAHDFNNILTSIIGFTELVYRDPTVPGPAREDLERVIQQGQRAAYLTRQILDFSRKSVLVKQLVDLGPFLQETVLLLEPGFPDNIDLVVEVEPDQQAYIINVDPIQFQQALTNLAVNARDAMPTGGRLRFRLSAAATLGASGKSADSGKQPLGWIALAISDTGVGIPPENRSYIFEPFFTTKAAGEGSGLGLAQVYGIVKQHGGDIELDSQVGQGTTFSIYLPRLPAPNGAPPISSGGRVEPAPEESPHGQGEIILLVDDDPGVRDVARDMLEQLGYRVLSATNGYEALAIYDAQPEDVELVLTDLTMPEMGGVELAQALRGRSADVKIVVMAGYLLATDAEELMTKNIRDWLLKPLQLEQLAETVEKLLRE